MSKETKILIVEDSPSQANIIARLVQQAGHTPAVYNEVPRGISQILNKEQPDLVLLDLRLLSSTGAPVADGFQICREIKRHTPKLPVIIVTAEGEDDACEWAILQGADAFIQKPFEAQALTEVILRTLSNKE